MASTVFPHPSPQRHRAPSLLLLAGFATGPVVLGLVLTITYAFSSHRCFPDGTRLNTPLAGWDWVSTIVPLLYAVGIVLSALSAVVAWRLWRRTRDEGLGETLELGEGRTRFLGVWGLITSVLFAAILAFDLLNTVLVPPCA
jgi:hypothetical protein